MGHDDERPPFGKPLTKEEIAALGDKAELVEDDFTIPGFVRATEHFTVNRHDPTLRWSVCDNPEIDQDLLEARRIVVSYFQDWRTDEIELFLNGDRDEWWCTVLAVAAIKRGRELEISRGT